MVRDENQSISGPEILIVEDSPTQAMELQLILERYGCRTVVCANGRQALEWLASNRPAMVISDIVMPELDGYGLCRAVRKDERLEGVPVVLLSYLSNARDVLKGLESGASNFIVKPYNPDYLISYMREELSGKSSAREIPPHMPVAISYEGKDYLISSNVRQILDILLATYGTAVHKNEELMKAEAELRELNEQLEAKVMERTAELTEEIAQRRRVEEELRAKSEELKAYAKRLEQSNRELQDFAHVASHDLQEPIRKIQTFADRLRISYNDRLDEKGRDCLERMRHTAKRMQDLVLDLLKYSRLGTGPGYIEPVDLKTLLDETVFDLGVLIEETDAVVEIGELPIIEADAVQMRQLFQNLIVNSIKYRGIDRPVVKIYETGPKGDGFHEIRVEDNGMGFDETYLEKIFKPFQRLHGRNSSYEGTGMGLAICRRIVERHGGTITARSEPGRGSIFMARLPEKQSKLGSEP